MTELNFSSDDLSTDIYPVLDIDNDNDTSDDGRSSGSEYSLNEDNDAEFPAYSYKLQESDQPALNEAHFIDLFQSKQRGNHLKHAKRLLTTQQHLDWVAAGGEIEQGDTLTIRYHLDYTCTTGMPLCPLISSGESLFTTAELSFSSWSRPYCSNHAFNLTHTLEGRTFHLAISESRIHWYLVFSPNSPEVLDIDTFNKQIKYGMKNSALRRDRAAVLVEYLIEVFIKSPRLAGAGVQRSWSLGNNHTGSHSTKQITLNSGLWRCFQEEMFNSWSTAMQFENTDPFWRDHTPCLHAYDYGQNVELKTDDPDYEFDKHLVHELARLYNIDNAATFSCALAANINGMDRQQDKYAILGDRQEIDGQYKNSRSGYAFYPIGLSPRAGNFQAHRAPAVIQEHLWNPVIEMSQNCNEGKRVLFPGAFQGYSIIKQVVRHTPRDFLPRQRLWQAALGLRHGLANRKSLNRQSRILDCLQCSANIDRANRPIAREVDQVEIAISAGTYGYRFEQIINVQVDELVPENRNLSYIVGISVTPCVKWWHENIHMWKPWVVTFDPPIFPGVLVAFGNMFDSLLVDLYMQFRDAGFGELEMWKAECAAHYELLASYAFTGEIKICPTKLWNYLGTLRGINVHGFPYMDPSKLSPFIGFTDVQDWPRNRVDDLLPDLTYIHALEFHYGSSVAKAHHFMAGLGVFTTSRINTINEFYSTIHNILERVMIPETREWISNGLSMLNKRLRNNAILELRATSNSITRIQDEAAIQRAYIGRSERLDIYRNSPQAFCTGNLASLIRCFVPEGPITGDKECWAIREYCSRIYEVLKTINWQTPHKESKAFVPRNASWHLCIAALIQQCPSHLQPINDKDCAISIAHSFERLRIQELPGMWRNNLSYCKFTTIASVWIDVSQRRRQAWDPRAIEELIDPRSRSVRNGIFHDDLSSKRAPSTQLAFDFSLPFEALPTIIYTGCIDLIELYRNSAETLDMSRQMQRCLDDVNLGDPMIQLALIMISILSMPTPLPCCPHMENKEGIFHDHDKIGREKDRWCSVLFFKMIWFLYRGRYTKEYLKILNERQGQQKISNRFLLEIGWVKLRKNTSRRHPQVEQVELLDHQVLHSRYKDYCHLLTQNPVRLASSIFRGERKWVESIIAMLVNRRDWE